MSMETRVIETERLTLRQMDESDAPFILELLNDPAFLQNIGDKNVRTLEDAVAYIRNAPIASYEKHGYGLYLVELKDGGASAGMCGLVRRDTLPTTDIGYAFLPQYCAKGYAIEAATATLEYARTVHGIDHILAIVSPGNDPSSRLLEKLGMQRQGMMKLTDNSPEVIVYSTVTSGLHDGEVMRTTT